jgi:spermidine synthase
VLIDVDHAPDDHLGPGNEGFYTRAGLERAKKHLTPGGILAVWSYADRSPFVEALRTAFQTVELVPVTYTNDLVAEEHTDWLFLAWD